MNNVSPFKQMCLDCVSSRALLVAIATSRRSVRAHAVWGFFAWLKIFLSWLSGEGHEAFKVPIREPRIINRRHRRSRARPQSDVSEISMLFHLFGRGVSRRQFMERLCKLSLYCRVRIYGIRSVGTVLVRRALLVCYDHGWWRAPLGILGRVYCGVWQVHMWPGWAW